MKQLAVAIIIIPAVLTCALPGAVNITPTVYVNYVPYTNTVQPTVRPTFVQPTPIETELVEQNVTIIATNDTQTETIVLHDVFPYQVVRGDTLYALALRYCGDAHKYKYLLLINGMEEGDILEIGQMIVIGC